MATSTNNVEPTNGLGNGRANGTRNIPNGLQREPDHEPTNDMEQVAVPAASDGAGVAVAKSESIATWNIEHSIGMRLLLAQQAVKTLDKDVTVKQSTNKDGKKFGGYSGISADQVVASAKEILTKNGILYTSDLAEGVEPRKNGNKTELKLTGIFENVDNPAEFRMRSSWGEGNDNSAHGHQKATTNADKIIIGKMLMMTTVEDEQAPIETVTDSAGSATREAKAETENTLRAWADNFKTALDKCEAVEDLKRVRSDNAHMLKSANLPDKTRDYFADRIAHLEDILS
jgi:hypothetical protein